MASLWDDIDITAVLVAPWNAGCSALEIAGRLGAPFTRNAVIAKIWRLRRTGVLLRQESPEVMSRRHARKRKEAFDTNLRRAPMHKGSVRDKLAKLATAKVPFSATPDPTAPTIFSVLDLVDANCRWVYASVGEPGFGFCGRERVAGLPYCGAHCRSAYRVVDAPTQAVPAPARQLVSADTA